MKFRTIKIIRMMTWAVSTFMRGDKLQLDQGSAKLEELGGIYIKFLQIVVLNLDPDNQHNYKDLLAVYEHSKPDKIDIKEYLRRHLSFRQLARLKSVSAEPFATGSFGQVYKAELTSGEQVVVKVIRPSVEKYLRYDIRLLSFLSWAYNLVDKQNLINFRTTFKHFKDTCLEETNYAREAAVANQYYQTYRGHPHFVIPKTHVDLCTQQIIVQDFIPGTSLTSLLEMQTSGGDAVRYVADNLGSNLYFQLQLVGQELLSKAVTGDILHADPHPGNIVILPHNRVALIDFGMATTLSENRYAFYEMLVQYIALYTGKLAIDEFALSALKFMERDLYDAILQADSLLNVSGELPEPIMNKVRSAIIDMFEDDTNQPVIKRFLERKMIMKVLFFAINKGNRFGFSFDLEAINLIKAAQNYMMVVWQFDKDNIVITNVLQETVRTVEANIERVVDLQPAKTSPDEAIETLSRWIDKMARNDPWMMRRLTAEFIE